MARQVGFKNRFNAGELGQDAWANSDLQQHANGCALAQNFIGRVTGSLRRREGFWWCGAPKHQDKAAIGVPFRRSIDDPLMLEFGDLYVRVWQADGTPLMDGAAQVEFASPYAEADLADLRALQTGDVITIRHADGSRPKQLVRTSNTVWTFSDYTPKNGPWRSENKDESFTVTVTRTGGSGVAYNDGKVPTSGAIMPGAIVSLEASQPLFDALQIGGLFAIRDSTGNPSVGSWAPHEAVGVTDFTLSDGKVYLKTADDGGGETGLTPPVHESGSVNDGRSLHLYLHDGRGVVRITAVASATEATAVVVAAVPLQSGATTAFWSEGAYSNYRGWPTAWPAVREERMIEGATPAEPDKFDASRTAGYDTTGADFKPGLGTGRVVDDDAIRRFAGDRSARIVWFASSTFLLAGTVEEELVITGATLDDPMSPAGTVARSISDFGSADVQPAKASKALLFVARGEQTLCSLSVAPDLSNATEDMSFWAEHIAEKGFKQIVWTGHPEYRAWTRLGDGSLAVLIYMPEQKVFGWYSQELGGGFKAEWLAVLPGSFGRTAVWVLASREKGGVTQRAWMISSAGPEMLRLDAAERYSGAPATGVSGLDHLEGEAVTAMVSDGADGFAEYAGLTVTDGAIVLPGSRTAGEIVVGLPYLSRFESLPADLEGPGTSQGKRVRFTKMIAVLTGVTARIGSTLSERLDLMFGREGVEAAALKPRRFNVSATIEGGADRDPRLVVETASGYDLQIHALRPDAQSNA